MSDTILLNTGMKALIDKLGNVNAEKFITLIIKEPFDYTKWHSKLYEGMTIDEISDRAMLIYNKI